MTKQTTTTTITETITWDEKKYQVRYVPTMDNEKNWLIAKFRSTQSSYEHKMIKNILDLICK